MPELRVFGFSIRKGMTEGPVTSSVYRKVTDVMKQLILSYTDKPSGEQYTTICRALVTKYPMLKGMVGNEIVSMELLPYQNYY